MYISMGAIYATILVSIVAAPKSRNIAAFRIQHLTKRLHHTQPIRCSYKGLETISLWEFKFIQSNGPTNAVL